MIKDAGVVNFLTDLLSCIACHSSLLGAIPCLCRLNCCRRCWYLQSRKKMEMPQSTQRMKCRC